MQVQIGPKMRPTKKCPTNVYRSKKCISIGTICTGTISIISWSYPSTVCFVRFSKFFAIETYTKILQISFRNSLHGRNDSKLTRDYFFREGTSIFIDIQQLNILQVPSLRNLRNYFIVVSLQRFFPDHQNHFRTQQSAIYFYVPQQHQALYT